MTLLASWVSTPLGDMLAVASATHLHLLEFMDRKALPAELKRLECTAAGGIQLGMSEPIEQTERELTAYFGGRSAVFHTPLALRGTSFRQRVWRELLRIPAGETRSYTEVARLIGRPTATRAVAGANGANQIAVMVPCHRVIGSDGSLTGYGGGLWRKRHLIELERRYRERSES